MYQSAQAVIRALGFTRGELFAGLYILGCANGLAAKMILSVMAWMDAAAHVRRHVIVVVACLTSLAVGDHIRTFTFHFGRFSGVRGRLIDLYAR